MLECDVEKASFDIALADGSMENLVGSVMKMRQSRRQRNDPFVEDDDGGHVYAASTNITESVDELRSLHSMCAQMEEVEKKQADSRRRMSRNPKEQEEIMKQRRENREKQREVIKSLVDMLDSD